MVFARVPAPVGDRVPVLDLDLHRTSSEPQEACKLEIAMVVNPEALVSKSFDATTGQYPFQAYLARPRTLTACRPVAASPLFEYAPLCYLCVTAASFCTL
jgi:hypothetical protein